jgi:hypothetical protein
VNHTAKSGATHEEITPPFIEYSFLLAQGDLRHRTAITHNDASEQNKRNSVAQARGNQ